MMASGMGLDEGIAEAEETAGANGGASEAGDERMGIETGFIGREESSKS